MPLKTSNNLTELQQMLFNTISHDLPNLPMKWQTEVREHDLIQHIQDMFDEIEGQPLNTGDAMQDDDWAPNGIDSAVAFLAERVTEDETCLIFLDTNDSKEEYTKYLINMKANTIKHWDGWPWSETRARKMQKQGAV